MSLRDRLPRHETIAEFEAARFDRFHDALTLGAEGRRLGAMYLLGYFVEMTLKSAFFRLLGFRADEPIAAKDLKTAAGLARHDLQVDVDPEQYHGLVFWVQAIIALRDHFGDPVPYDVLRELAWRSQRMSAYWRPSMRYSRDVTVPNDWRGLLADAHWLRENCDKLAVATSN